MIPFLMEQYSKGNFPLEELVTCYPIQEYASAIKDMETGKTLKGVLVWK